MQYFLDVCKVLWRYRERMAPLEGRAHSGFEIDAVSQRLKTSLSSRRKESLFHSRGGGGQCEKTHVKQYRVVFRIPHSKRIHKGGQLVGVEVGKGGSVESSHIPYILTLFHHRVNEEICPHLTQLSCWSFLAAHSLYQFYTLCFRQVSFVSGPHAFVLNSS